MCGVFCVFCFECILFLFIIPYLLFSAYYVLFTAALSVRFVLHIIDNFLFINLPARPLTFPGNKHRNESR